MMSFSFFIHFISCEFFSLWIVKLYLLNVVCVRSFKCSKTFLTFRRRIKCVRTQLILTFYLTCSITRSIYTIKVSNNFFFRFSQHYCKSLFKMRWIISFLMHLSKKKHIYSTTTRASCHSVLLMILLILNILFKLILWMIFIIFRCVIGVSSSIDEK